MKSSSLGLPSAVNDRSGRKDRVAPGLTCPESRRVFATAGPMSAFYVALSLLVPEARRRVYELKPSAQ